MEKALSARVSSPYSQSFNNEECSSAPSNDDCGSHDHSATPERNNFPSSGHVTFGPPSSTDGLVSPLAVYPALTSSDQSPSAAGGDQNSDKSVKETDGFAGRTDEAHLSSFDLRRARLRLGKCRLKAEQLRQSSESRHRMTGALHVRRTVVMGDVISMTQQVMTSRHSLDEQRRANKELMKQIELLTIQDNLHGGDTVVSDGFVTTATTSIPTTSNMATCTTVLAAGADGDVQIHRSSNNQKGNDSYIDRNSSSSSFNKSNNSSNGNCCSGCDCEVSNTGNGQVASKHDNRHQCSQTSSKNAHNASNVSNSDSDNSDSNNINNRNSSNTKESSNKDSSINNETIGVDNPNKGACNDSSNNKNSSNNDNNRDSKCVSSDAIRGSNTSSKSCNGSNSSKEIINENSCMCSDTISYSSCNGNTSSNHSSSYNNSNGIATLLVATVQAATAVMATPAATTATSIKRATV